jgi:hypothetical protein
VVHRDGFAGDACHVAPPEIILEMMKGDDSDAVQEKMMWLAFGSVVVYSNRY